MSESEEKKIMNWFGDLNLAFKYSLIFGGLVVITVIMGVIKLIIDKRRMNKFIKDMESQPAEKRASDNDQVELNMREKDEGDLFGIRAIEAGFYGGVAQSRPTSAAATPIPSRPTSPAYGSKLSTYAPSLASQSTVHGHGNGSSKHLADTRSFSATSSTLSQGQFRDSQSPSYCIPSNAPSKLRTPLPQASDIPQLHLSSQSRDSIPRTASPASDSKFRNPSPASSESNLHNPARASQFDRDLPPLPVLRLAPSQAELNGRLKHTPVEMSVEVPPSPKSSSPKQRKAPPPNLKLSGLDQTGLRLRLKSPRSPMSPRSPKSPRHLMPPTTPGAESNRMSQMSTSTYYPESTYGDAEEPAVRMNQDHTGHLTVVNGHKSAAASMRGSIDEDREQFEVQESENAPKPPPLGLSSSRPSTAKERAHDSTSTFADLEDYFARQPNSSARPRSSAYQDDEEEDNRSNHDPPNRATSSLAASNRTSMASAYPERENVKIVKVNRPTIDKRQAWTARVRLPTGAPF